MVSRVKKKLDKDMIIINKIKNKEYDNIEENFLLNLYFLFYNSSPNIKF